MSHNPYGDNGDSFLYDGDEVPFDEIPPEPGREIKASGFGDLVIRVRKDSNNDAEGYPSDNEASSPTNSNARYIGPLQRTIHQPERIVHEPKPHGDYDDHHDFYERSRKRRNISSDNDRGNYGRDVRRARPTSADEGYYEIDHSDNLQPYHVPSSSHHSGYDYDSRNLQVEANYPVNLPNGRPIKPDLRQHKNANHRSQGNYRDHHYDPRPPNYSHRVTDNHRVGPHELVIVNERKYQHAPDDPPIQGSGPHLNSTTQSSSMCKRQPLLSNAKPKSSYPITKPNSRPLSERLGPPVKKPLISQKPQPSVSRPVNTNQKPTNFIKRNIASTSAAKNKHVASRPVTVRKIGPQTASAKQGPQIKKVTKHNPISKAKQKVAPKKTNLQKNMALLTQSGNQRNNTTAGVSSPTAAGPGKGPNAIADLIHGILSEPDVKEMITTIAKQSVSVPSEQTSAVDQVPTSSTSNPQQKDDNLEADVKRTLDRANQLLNDNFQGIDATKFKTNRQIPTAKIKHVKISQYCKECKLEFPTTIMRDLHFKTEMHCFVNGDWWKFNPKPPTRISKSKFPISIFCILCWDIVRAQTDDALTTHITSKRHKTNKQKFQEIFGRLPLYDWCMWEELSLNFRNNFVPVPSQLRNVMHPEYFYDQRVYKK